MHRWNKKLKILFLTLGVWGGLAASAGAVDDTIIAVVNDDVITLQDLHDFLNIVYIQLTSEGTKPQEIESIMQQYQTDGINRLIEQKLLIDEANRKGMTIKPSYIDGKLETIRQKYKSEKEFREALQKDGMSLTDLRNRITDQTKAKFIIEREIRDKLFVNPQEVTDYYHQHPDEFHQPEGVELDSIFIPFEDANQRTWAISVQEALDKLKGGADFGEVMNTYSKAPSIGSLEKGTLLPEIEQKIFSLQPGENSSAIETDRGVYIFKIKAKHSATMTALEEVKDSIQKKIFQQKFKNRLQDWLSKLRKQAYVEIKQ